MTRSLWPVPWRLICLAALAGAAHGQPSIAAAVNSASFQPAISRGCLVTIFGAKLADSTTSAGSLPLPRKLAGTAVTVGELEIDAPLSFVSPGQINAQIPFEVLGDRVPLWVSTAAGKSQPVFVSLTASAPGLFTRSSDGKGAVLALSQNFQLTEQGAPGSPLILYATGLGATDPPALSGSPGAGIEPLNRVVEMPEVFIGEYPARVDFAGLAPGLNGVYQLNVVPQRMGSDRIFIRSHGISSNIASIASVPGNNVANASGSIQALYPLMDSPWPILYSPLLLLVKFTARMDILPSAGPFLISAVTDAGTTFIDVDPAAGTYTGTITVPSIPSRFGDFSASGLMAVDFATCSADGTGSVTCLPFPGNIVPASRIPPPELDALRSVPAPDMAIGNSPNGTIQVRGSVRAASTFVIDGQTNSSLAVLGGYSSIPLPAKLPGYTGTTTVKLFIDGRLVASTDVPYHVGIF
ncbi:MAG TPA: hypothetical protein VMH28_26325 [Candidatus Acidoferrales bacterium]|nr:hypothetical protein [Candidatus Acidoferrales bacterium]